MFEFNNTLAFSEAWDEQMDERGRVVSAYYYLFPSCSTRGRIDVLYSGERGLEREYRMYHKDERGWYYLGASHSYGIAKSIVASAVKEEEENNA